jgi:DNA-binding FadR family transcriptional regulator
MSMKFHKEILKALKIKDKKKLKTIILEHWIPPLP